MAAERMDFSPPLHFYVALPERRSKLKSGASGYNIAIRPCGDEEGLCAIRIILKKTGKSSRLSAG
jgi:hypothetical protein